MWDIPSEPWGQGVISSKLWESSKDVVKCQKRLRGWGYIKWTTRGCGSMLGSLPKRGAYPSSIICF